ncbi:hypothetical protein GE300_18310 [Rhodobacteraceae bacterium 2CG4]|uniref:Uncharacterized protein n=1 Tax=Halovulum marinum TaxID=2662447 RepID=A0A6L5Z4Q0_9RHOB|nr:tetratricopeptide repeat protein [Halovulum marinum]MSU91536.1 hypothetical protein [Halovulum marinum]
MTRVPADTSSWVLDPDSAVRRRAPRDPALRHRDFDSRYDDRSVFFDLFRTEDPQRLVALGPPLLNLAEDLALTFRAEPSGQMCSFVHRRLVNVDRIEIAVPAGTERLTVRWAAGETVLTPSPSLVPDFAGQRAVFTMSRDNDLQWIRDWAQYYVRVHGATAAVIYDNGSARYAPEDVARALAGVEGLDRHAVLAFPFPYGPCDHRRPATLWLTEADYCQRVSLEHAMQRLFARAASVVNADVDELIYAASGRSVFEAAETCDTGYIEARGVWIEAAHDGRVADVRHAAFSRRVDAQPWHSCEPKWAAAPAKLPAEARFSVHSVFGAAPAPASLEFCFGHFRGINTNWDLHLSNNTREARTATDGTAPLAEVPELRAALDRAFPDRSENPIPTPRPVERTDVIADFALQSAELAEEKLRPDAPAPVHLHHSSTWRVYPSRRAAAIDAGLRALELKPRSLPCLEAVVPLLLRAGLADRAVSLVDLAAEPSDPARPARWRALRARCLMEIDPAAALAQIDAAILQAPDRPGYHLLKARLLLDAGDNEAALAAARRGETLLDRPDRLLREAAIEAERGTETGLFTLHDPLNLELVHPRELWRVKLVALRRLERFAEAVEAARRLVASDPLQAHHHAELARVLAAAGQDAAAAEARAAQLAVAHRTWQAGELVPTSTEPRQIALGGHAAAYAQALIVNGRIRDAIETIAPLFEHEPLPVGPIAELAELLAQQGRPQRARDLLDRAERLAPDAAELVGARAATLAAAERWKPALRAALRLPDTAVDTALRVLPGIAAALFERGEHDLAAQGFERAAALKPGAFFFRVRAYRAREALQDRPAARRMAECMARDFPDEARAHVFLGKELLADNEIAAATREARIALALAPELRAARVLGRKLGVDGPKERATR